jgi:hypothetical protein
MQHRHSAVGEEHKARGGDFTQMGLFGWIYASRWAKSSGCARCRDSNSGLLTTNVVFLVSL